MLELKEMIARIAPTEASILIQGESGTGKELVARAVHHHSRRRSEVFVPVDCAALHETVIESELFGHTKGAFTGADQNAQGLMRSADRGTLFLDEVGEIPLKLQAKLLRTLQERTVRPVGSARTIPIDIRVVAATNRNLIDATADGSFRQDLYYRLSGVTLHVPPLRERGTDIPLLCRFFLERFAGEGFPAKEISEGALAVLQGSTWPGNVRQMENAVRAAMLFSKSDTIQPLDLKGVSGPAPPSSVKRPADCVLSAYEEDAIRAALDRTGGNRRNAARLLGISESTMYRRIRLYNL